MSVNKIVLTIHDKEKSKLELSVFSPNQESKWLSYYRLFHQSLLNNGIGADLCVVREYREDIA